MIKILNQVFMINNLRFGNIDHVLDLIPSNESLNIIKK